MRVEWLCLDTNLESVLELENKMTLFFFSLFKKKKSHLYLYLYNFHCPLPFGNTKNKFNFCYLWQLAIQLFIHSFHRPLLSSNHMHALRIQRSKIPSHVLKNGTVYYSAPLQFLLYGVNTLVPFVIPHVSRFQDPLLLFSFEWVGAYPSSLKCGVWSW